MAAFWISQQAITNATAFEEYLCPMSERHRGRNPRALCMENYCNAAIVAFGT